MISFDQCYSRAECFLFPVQWLQGSSTLKLLKHLAAEMTTMTYPFKFFLNIFTHNTIVCKTASLFCTRLNKKQTAYNQDFARTGCHFHIFWQETKDKQICQNMYWSYSPVLHVSWVKRVPNMTYTAVYDVKTRVKKKIKKDLAPRVTLRLLVLSFLNRQTNSQRHSTAVTDVNPWFPDAGLTLTNDFKKNITNIISLRGQQRAQCLWCQYMAQEARMISSTGCLNGLQ